MPKRRAAEYSVKETIRDGSVVEIRAQRQTDRNELLAAFQRTSQQSLFRRFFAPKRSLSDREIAYFMDADFDRHVALVAVVEGRAGPGIVGGGRYIRTALDQAELAFFVTDPYQGQGIGTLLLRHLIRLAHDAGLRELAADVLPENQRMLAVFTKTGFAPTRGTDLQVIHLALRLTPAGSPAPG